MTYTGWGIGKGELKPFTKNQYSKSYLAKSKLGGKMSYAEYLYRHRKSVVERKTRSDAQKKAKRRSSNSLGLLSLSGRRIRF